MPVAVEPEEVVVDVVTLEVEDVTVVTRVVVVVAAAVVVD